MLKIGSWWIKSIIDPRWNCRGRDNYCGGFTMPSECKKKIQDLEIELGSQPDDLEYGYMKD